MQRLRAAGAIVIGKTNVAAMLADFGQTANQLYGRTNNPHALDRSPGGSSGGSAPGWRSSGAGRRASTARPRCRAFSSRWRGSAWARYVTGVDAFLCPVNFTAAITHDERPFDQRTVSTVDGVRRSPRRWSASAPVSLAAEVSRAG